MAGTEREAARVIVRGRVQGVWFRASAQEAAQDLGLDGWVRNLPDGAVELFLEGRPEKVKEMIRWCRTGPPLAVVRAVEVSRETPAGERGFRISR